MQPLPAIFVVDWSQEVACAHLRFSAGHAGAQPGAPGADQSRTDKVTLPDARRYQQGGLRTTHTTGKSHGYSLIGRSLTSGWFWSSGRL